MWRRHSDGTVEEWPCGAAEPVEMAATCSSGGWWAGGLGGSKIGQQTTYFARLRAVHRYIATVYYTVIVGMATGGTRGTGLQGPPKSLVTPRILS